MSPRPGAPETGAPSGLNRTQPPARGARPPLEPPQLGQLTRPLQPPATEATTSPSGLPHRPGAAQTPASWPPPAAPGTAPDAPAGTSGEEAPSGLPGRPQQALRPDPDEEQNPGSHEG